MDEEMELFFKSGERGEGEGGDNKVLSGNI
jgi:hypothetical protein